MTTIGKANLAPPAFEQQQAGHECCMCGDYGLSCELFQCSLCLFRSQHRYCSNLYPKAESYTLCNWCLHDSDKPPPHNSSNSSSSCKNSSGGDDDSTTSNKHQGKPLRGGLQIKKLPVRSPEGSPSPSPSPRKRIITNGRLEEIRRTKSEEIAKNNKNNGNGNGTTTTTTTKQQVFKNKVRRYKLLDEVSS